MTETLLFTLTPKDKMSFDDVGILLSNTKVKFIDQETGKPNPRGKAGEIVVKSPFVSEFFF